ncbi:MAG: trypsin-like peptidase domain-containing protein, partial [Saprospiraceae bacterium]|nr:trypsin-like peptidase domain-containing protein [Saprospiraceae bacterium]
MRKLLSLVLAGMAGGLIVLCGALYLDQDEGTKTNKNARFASSAYIDALPPDFRSAAQKTMPAVVHISAVETREGALNRYQEERTRRSPFSFFLDEDLFDFFGRPQQKSGKGSGVVIASDGFIVTNNHVIDFADQIEVTLFDDRKFKADLIGTDPRTDLAVLKIDAIELPALIFGNSDQVQVGEWVLAVGNPFDLTSTVTAGIVSAKGRSKIIRRTDAIEDFIQTDAVVNPGNSGG